MEITYSSKGRLFSGEAEKVKEPTLIKFDRYYKGLDSVLAELFWHHT